MTQRKPIDVYFYIRLSPEKIYNYELYHNTLMKYCTDKKSLRISGSFVEYCEGSTSTTHRSQLQRLLNMSKNTKFLICSYDKSTVSENKDEVVNFENTIKSQGGSTYFHLDVITERQQKSLAKSYN